MKKIMFDDRFRLTQAVLEGRKTMTRRIISEKLRERAYYCDSILEYLFRHSSYKALEVVAVAQSYSEIEKEIERDGLPLTLKGSILKTLGYRNKMFVKAELMPHQIRITSVSIERLQDISDEECVREGMSFVNGRFYVGFLKTTGQRIWLDGDTPREAFAALIDKVSGKGTWARNPWVYVYEFELVR